MSATLAAKRIAPVDHPILDVLQARWSPRTFADRHISESSLSTTLEAARWSPSAYNAQPWRFVVARQGTDAFERVADVLVEFNREWASKAAVLILAVAETVSDAGRAQPTAVYDLGQAVAHLTVQAHAEGLVVHQMSGFDVADAVSAFSLRDGLLPVTVIALGHLGELDALSPVLQEREQAPRVRKGFDEILIAAE